MKKLINMIALASLITAFIAAPSFAQDKQWEKIKKSGVISVGISPDYPPFESIDDAGRVVGFDVDLMNAITAKMGLTPKIMKMGFDAIIVATKHGQVNMGMSSFSVTPERQKSVDFTIPYYSSSQVVVTSVRSGITSVADLKGEVVAAQMGSTSADAAKKIEGAKLKITDDANIAMMMLKTGVVKAVVLDVAIAQEYAKKDDFKRIGKPLTHEETAILIQKGHPEMLEELNKAIKSVQEDGTYERLRKKWGV